MAYRPYTYVRNNSSWGATFHTKKGVLKRGPFPSDEPAGCGTLKPPPDGSGGPNEVFVLFWNGQSQSWKWGKVYYQSAVVPNLCGGEGESALVQTFSPLNLAANPCAEINWQFFGVYDAECEQNA